MKTNQDNELQQAPAHVKLAVDLIMLLEQNDIPPDQALQALEIVTQDYKGKLQTSNSSSWPKG